MTDLFAALTGSKPTCAVLGAGLLFHAVVMFVAIVLYRTRAGAVKNVLELATVGQRHEARVQARRAGALGRPLLAALSANPRTLRARPLVGDRLLLASTAIPPIALVCHGVVALSPREASMMPSLLLGFAILIPVTAAAIVVVAHLGARLSGTLRAASVAVLAHRLQREAHGFSTQESCPSSPPLERSVP